MNAINTEVKALRKILTWMIELSNTIRINLFFTLKDRKENFQNNPKRRLKNQKYGSIKHCIDQINKYIREIVNVNQWRKTQAVITQFKNIKSKSTKSFYKIRHRRFSTLHIKGPFIRALSGN